MQKMCFAIILSASLYCANGHALHVIDSSNLAQNIVAAQEAIVQTQQQIQQLQTQLNAYKRMLQDAMNPGDWVWGDIQQTINQLKHSMNSIKDYSSMAGGFDQMLSQFGSYDSYTTGAGYGGGYSQSSQQLTAGDYLGSKMVKNTSDDLLRIVKEQEEQLDAYQAEFERLKSNAASAEGQQEAIQATNQFASMQVQLLTQIHALMMAQNNMLAVITQDRNNREARDRMGSAIQLGETEAFKQEREGAGVSFGFTD
ncbi:MAG: P-type conjugative transfer protein TrbJ [Planctomycetota bacterium]|jgi:P-type conjugative transfer protein TrbJ|nr:P-type conjugative transfer protein TrbJ [Planctomycetota bacterium]